MVTDQELARGVESVLRQADPNAVMTLNGVVQQLEAKLGLDLSHKAGFIRDQINRLCRPHAQPQPSYTLKDYQLLHQQLQAAHSQQLPSHFAFQTHFRPEAQHLAQPPRPPVPQPQSPANFRAHPLVGKSEGFSQNAVPAGNVAPEAPKESVVTGTKRRGGSGGLNKVCGVSPELQAVVGEPALPRTEIVKQLWAYIRKNKLQDPSNKRKIICDDALRLVFETDCTDMFKMNKLLAKHIIPLESNKESTTAKRVKVDVESCLSTDPGSSPVIISESLAKFLGSNGREMLQSEAIRQVWEYIKVNSLEDPISPMVVLCDAKLSELLGCESISAVGIQEMLVRHHLFKRS